MSDVSLCTLVLRYVLLFFFFKQKTSYEMRISDWSSDVCSSDLRRDAVQPGPAGGHPVRRPGQERGGPARQQPVAPRPPYLRRGPALYRYLQGQPDRSAARRVGNVCVRTCRSRLSPYPSNTKQLKSKLNRT